jgi:hypothetical protein
MGAVQMAQPSSTIAEAIYEAQAKLREASVQPVTSIGASSIGRNAELSSHILQGQDGTKDPAQASRETRQPWLETPELLAIQSPTAPDDAPTGHSIECPSIGIPPTSVSPVEGGVARMAHGVGGPNIDLPVPSANSIEVETAIEELRGRWFPTPEWPIQTGRKAKVVWIGRFSFVFSMLAIVGTVGVKLFAFLDEAGKQVSDIRGPVMPLHDGLSKAGRSAHPARFVVENQMGVANEPLPLGILLKGASSGETVTVEGLMKGTDLSLGIPRGSDGWLVSTADLDKTFVGAPQDFVGVMEATVNLRSASNQLLDRQIVRLEWMEKKEERLEKEEHLIPPLGQLEPTLGVLPLDAEQTAAHLVVSPPEPTPGVLPFDAEQTAAHPVASPPPPIQRSRHANRLRWSRHTVPEQPAAHPVVSPPEPTPGRPPLDAEQTAALIKLGEDLLKQGDIATARVLLKRAAIAGDAQAALELGMTFDQAALAQWGVLGPAPDAAQAREWYDRAIKIGSTEASRHLERLANMAK